MRPLFMDTKSDDMGMGAGDETMSQGMAPADEKQHEVMLSADNFPEGMAPKNGAKLTFCCTADPDSEGNVSGYFEMSSGGMDDGEDWDSEFKKSMSPRRVEESAA